jgi:serine/threonine protein kinase
VCDALEYLHSQNPPIIHRDIKPANIKITPQGKAILVDFGIAKVYDPILSTATGARAATPGYSQPEQYNGRTDTRSDVYALGATLYHLLTAQMIPESGLRAVGCATIIPPLQINPSIRTRVDQAILRAIEINSNQRFQSIVEFKVALGMANMVKHITFIEIHKKFRNQSLVIIIQFLGGGL